MKHRIIRCAICNRQIIPKSTENTERTIGSRYGDGYCLRLVNGVVCPKCTPEEIEWGKMMEGVEDYE